MNKGDYLYHRLQENEVCKQQTHKATALFTLSVQVSSPWSVHGVPSSKTNGQWQKILHKVPFQVHAVAFPFCSDAT